MMQSILGRGSRGLIEAIEEARLKPQERLLLVVDQFEEMFTHQENRKDGKSKADSAAFVKLQAENLGNPRPGLLFMLWRGSHPALGERIDFCNEYRPWLEGDALRYGDQFE